MEFIVHSDVQITPQEFFRERAKERPELSERFGRLEREYDRLEKDHRSVSTWSFEKGLFYILSKHDFLSEDPKSFASNEVASFARMVFSHGERETIGSKAEEIKSEAGKIVDENLRTKLLKAADEIETSLTKMKRLDEHDQKIAVIEGEIEGVRRLIGTTKEYQDWRVLVSDVAEFKKTPHVTKDLFDSEIKRLDQRIDALKEIRFWSKRTIIDIVLASIATASTIIAALLAKGIIHF
jgi:hypothetical protein